MNNDITEQYLEKLYDDLSREQSNLMGQFRNVKEAEEETFPALKQRQLTHLNTLMTGVLRYRNIKRDIRKKSVV
jgi:hypothetical protein